MQFTLTYRGPLESNGTPKEKHAIRKTLHPQLKRAWELPPLNDFRHFIEQRPAGDPFDGCYACKQVGQFVFAPLVSNKAHIAAKLSVLMLRPNPLGHIVHGGDIDNRLKTLFDALCVPPHANQLTGFAPGPSENPFFCTFEDDSLIKAISVETDVLLDALDVKSSEVQLVIKVETVVTRPTIENMGF